MNSTQQHIPIEQITDDLIFLKDGGISQVLVTSAVNFALLFENEQISIINAFAQLLNSLSFPIQIVVLSRRLDVSSYLGILEQVISQQPNPALKKLTFNYRNYVESLIKNNEVLDKQFYIALNVSPLEIGLLSSNFENRLKRAVTVLSPRRDHLIRQFTRIGLKAKPLTSSELIKLFYDIYNTAYIENVVTPQQTQSPIPVKSEPGNVNLNKTTSVPISQSLPPQMPAQGSYQEPIPLQQPIPLQSNSPQQTGQIIQSRQASNIPFIVEELKDDGQ